PEGWGKTVRRYVPSAVFDALATKHSQ
ncbi:MAG TPA: pantetheine-phosphate adenylyltransferase, partial [Verrucomicrobiales bacterium]|nr:pantetheine-phosphate adenylyltransferase [Verrucomicrobiales bacterium]